MNILLHSCCATCLAASAPAFADATRLVAFFYNPNIHPLLEFRKRLKAFELLAQRQALEYEAVRDYGLFRFLQLVPPDGSGRCRICYRERLAATARQAAQTGADAFSTTLLSSTHQDHDAIRTAGEQVAAETGLAFIYRDLRSRASDGLALAKKLSLYRQSYCGCIFSEYERYKDATSGVGRGVETT